MLGTVYMDGNRVHTFYLICHFHDKNLFTQYNIRQIFYYEPRMLDPPGYSTVKIITEGSGALTVVIFFFTIVILKTFL